MEPGASQLHQAARAPSAPGNPACAVYHLSTARQAAPAIHPHTTFQIEPFCIRYSMILSWVLLF